MDVFEQQQLKQKANILRQHVIRMTSAAESGHPGGSLSAADIISVLYFKKMNIDSNNPKDSNRDRFVLSKGHAAPILYAALAEKGFFSIDKLNTLRQIGSDLQGHPDMKVLPGVEMSTGSLGQGFSVAGGIALGSKLDNANFHVYTMIGDGELQEGIIWEAAMLAAHYRLDNLIAILDYNGLQIDGAIADVMSPEPINEKWKAFGWNVIEIDGHHISEIDRAIDEAKDYEGKPTIIIAKTVKGKGVSFMEGVDSWHGKACSGDETLRALAELQEQIS